MQLLKNCIGPTIRIGPEIQCLPYAGFFLLNSILLHGNDCLILMHIMFNLRGQSELYQFLSLSLLSFKFRIKHNNKLHGGRPLLAAFSWLACQRIGLIQAKEEGWTGFSEGWQGCSEGFPEG